ncbi:MAG: GTPase ObgE [Bacteroidetes bacterium]|nr:GTPase ObgE [Bacteroidota bacterium]
MASTNFIDYVSIYCRSGNGGSGAVHFRREKHVPKGGPDGGDGGRGGHIVLKGNKQLWTLLHLKYKKHILAGNGGVGQGNNKTGADGKDSIIEVPLGTVAKRTQSTDSIAEITEDSQEVILLKGGKGGMGNEHFKSATKQTPRYAQPGEEGLEESLVFELKLLADVGLVGFPNAGKSTLLSVISAAKPKIADYPFTTLVPNLGVVQYHDFKSFVVADIPGIIEGAAEGKGLGTRFLRHIERNSILLFMIPSDSEDIQQEYYILLKELEKYNPELMDKKKLVAISKIDLVDDAWKSNLLKKMSPSISPIFISSITGSGINKLKDEIWDALGSE